MSAYKGEQRRQIFRTHKILGEWVKECNLSDLFSTKTCCLQMTNHFVIFLGLFVTRLALGLNRKGTLRVSKKKKVAKTRKDLLAVLWSNIHQFSISLNQSEEAGYPVKCIGYRVV